MNTKLTLKQVFEARIYAENLSTCSKCCLPAKQFLPGQFGELFNTNYLNK